MPAWNAVAGDGAVLCACEPAPPYRSHAVLNSSLSLSEHSSAIWHAGKGWLSRFPLRLIIMYRQWI